MVILAVTALLVNAAPARELDTGPYLATLNTKQVSFDVTITPANRGANEMHLFTLSRTGSTIDPTEVSAELSQSENNIATDQRQAHPARSRSLHLDRVRRPLRG